MKIVIDARMYQESGIGRYIRNLIEELQKIDRTNIYFLLLLKKDYQQKVFSSNFTKVLVNFSWYGFTEQIKLPGVLASLKPDLVHFPHFNVPYLYSGRFVVTIHDLIHQHFAMKRATTLDPITYKLKSIGYKKVFTNAIKKSEKILVPSSFVKKQLLTDWEVTEDEQSFFSSKILVTPEAVDDKIPTIVGKMSQQKSKKILDKFGIKPPYIFYVGNAHPHKNVEGLIKAYLMLKKANPVSLVLSGYDHYFWQRIRRNFEHPGIIYTGNITDEELVALYKTAKAFVMPSFEEGFGIPILEAMACSCPVVSSNCGSLKEVGGEAALYFNPHDIKDMENKIDMVFKSKDLREELVEKGQKRVKLFSWEKLAGQTLEVYTKCGLQ